MCCVGFGDVCWCMDVVMLVYGLCGDVGVVMALWGCDFDCVQP